MSMTGTVLALLATGAAKMRIPVDDPRKRRIEELEAWVTRVTEERNALQEAADAFAKEKARADSATKQLVEARAQANRMADGYRHMAEAYRHEHARSEELADRLMIYEGRRPNMMNDHHLCCVPQRHDFFYRAIASFLPREMRVDDRDAAARLSMGYREPHAHDRTD